SNYYWNYYYVPTAISLLQFIICSISTELTDAQLYVFSLLRWTVQYKQPGHTFYRRTHVQSFLAFASTDV
ncbi:Os02g0610700, partial [Oryza sativa Japonica Group]